MIMNSNSSSGVRKGVVLAGGLGTRLLPLTRDVPKEMLPLGPRPILHHIVEELKRAGIEDIIIVSRKGKRAIADYFEGEPGIRIVEKNKAKGPGHSVLVARKHLANESFLVAFGDSPYAGTAPESFIRKMLDVHSANKADAVLAAQKVPRNETHLRGMIETAGSLDDGSPAVVTAFVQKPKASEAPGRWAAAGRYVLAPSVFDALHTVAARTEGEILLADAFKHMLATGRRMLALPLDAGVRRFDTGGLEGYFEAFQAFL
jgi:UTP--glucose-1-phosphate uridylyltransferase